VGSKGIERKHPKINPDNLIKDIEALANGRFNRVGGAHGKMMTFEQVLPIKRDVDVRA
jgi:hypothetical protein